VEHTTDGHPACSGLRWVLEGNNPCFTPMACELPSTAFICQVTKLRAATTGFPIDGKQLILPGGDRGLVRFAAPDLR